MDELGLSYIIPSLAPQEINEKMWAIRSKFVGDPPLVKKYPESVVTLDTAHITLKRRFYLQESITDDDLVVALDTIKKEAIHVHSEKIKIFKSERLGNVVVALIENSRELQKLHDNVIKALHPLIISSNDFEGRNFKPHLSFMYSVREEIVEEVRCEVEKVILPLSYTLDNFYLLKNIPSIKRERTVVKQFTFS